MREHRIGLRKHLDDNVIGELDGMPKPPTFDMHTDGYVGRVARGSGWWLSSSDHVVSDDVPAAPQEVRDFYCDLDNVARVHPLVVSVETLAREETVDFRTQTYRVRDRLQVGPVTIAITYTARLYVPTRGDVATEARQFPRVRLYGDVSFDPFDGGTRLTERLRIVAPRPLAAMTTREAVRAHTTMLAGIRRCFE